MACARASDMGATAEENVVVGTSCKLTPKPCSSLGSVQELWGSLRTMGEVSPGHCGTCPDDETPSAVTSAEDP